MNFNLLRPVVFADLKVGEVLTFESSTRIEIMAKIKAAEATRKVLNWLVARCLGCLQSDDPINVQTFLRQNKRGAYNFTGDGDQLLDVIESRQIGFLPAGPRRPC